MCPVFFLDGIENCFSNNKCVTQNGKKRNTVCELVFSFSQGDPASGVLKVISKIIFIRSWMSSILKTVFESDPKNGKCAHIFFSLPVCMCLLEWTILDDCFSYASISKSQLIVSAKVNNECKHLSECPVAGWLIVVCIQNDHLHYNF